VTVKNVKSEENLLANGVPASSFGIGGGAWRSPNAGVLASAIRDIIQHRRMVRKLKFQVFPRNFIWAIRSNFP
jgi:hypothetical protein